MASSRLIALPSAWIAPGQCCWRSIISKQCRQCSSMSKCTPASAIAFSFKQQHCMADAARSALLTGSVRRPAARCKCTAGSGTAKRQLSAIRPGSAAAPSCGVRGRLLLLRDRADSKRAETGRRPCCLTGCGVEHSVAQRASLRSDARVLHYCCSHDDLGCLRILQRFSYFQRTLSYQYQLLALISKLLSISVRQWCIRQRHQFSSDKQQSDCRVSATWNQQ